MPRHSLPLELTQLIGAVQSDIRPEAIHRMPRKALLALQTRLGLGEEWGVLEMPERWMPPGSARLRSKRRCDIHFYASAAPNVDDHELLLLTVTRFALLCFLVPARTGRGVVLLAPTSLINSLRQVCVLCRFAVSLPKRSDGALLDRVELDSIQRLPRTRNVATEIARLLQLSYRGLWTDVPTVQATNRNERSRSAPAAQASLPHKEKPYLPLSDAFVAAAGWRLAWLAESLGPCLVACAKQLAAAGRKFPSSEGNPGTQTGRRKRAYAAVLLGWSWQQRDGTPIENIPFNLDIKGSGSLPGSRFEWPPRTGAQAKELLKLLQAAHLFIFLLSTGGRISEALSLSPGCVVESADGVATVDGRTYKLVFNENGAPRDWPLPKLAVAALQQQEELAKAIAELGAIDEVDAPTSDSSSIWVRFGTNGEEFTTHYNYVLKRMVVVLGLSDELGDTRIHAHRFRKTIARLIALAIASGAPKILMDLFGHKTIEMTLHYILTDPSIRAEIDEVAKAQIVMLAETSIATAEQNAGPAAKSIREAVNRERVRLGREFGEADIRSLAETFTLSGKHWQLVRPGVVCTKGPQVAGPCNHHVGLPEPSRCRWHCEHRLEDAALRDDIDRSIAEAISHLVGAEANDDPIGAEMWRGQILSNVRRFHDVAEKWRQHPIVSPLMAFGAAS